MSALGFSILMATMDMSIVNVCIKPIADAFGVNQADCVWIVDAYSIALAAFSIFAGKVGDRKSSTIIHRYGLFFFCLFSFLCGSSWSLHALVFFRAFQGAAASFMLSNAMSLTTVLSPREKLPATMALNSIAASVGTALGPILGGFLCDLGDWRWVFYINLVPGIGSLIACWMMLPKTPHIKEERFDWQGSFLMLVSLAMIIFGITRLETSFSVFFWNILFGAAILALTCVWEWRHPCAIFPKRLMTNKAVMWSLMAGMFNFLLVSPASFLLPFMLQWTYGYTPTMVGLMTLVLPRYVRCWRSLGRPALL
eukprot:gnl/Ergobibamus_cyprinoides/549.p1 GENE.gnl/Ergobibamus_cyprinoides/549~~gnl/Ergobibamus_cyprinoides/549.p1  ORF type:complete len:350 (+),score=127.98 gnl/Ergobibamus_cyprinoides/549:122-1051(+)